MTSSLSHKRSLSHLNKDKYDADIGDEFKSNKRQKTCILSKLFHNDLDQSQFVNIFQAIEKTRIYVPQTVIQLIAEFSTGTFEPCANEHCLQNIPILNETKSNYNANKFSSYQREWKSDQLLCSQCILFMLNLKKIGLHQKSRLINLSEHEIYSMPDLNKYERKRYLLFHLPQLSPDIIDALFDIKKCKSTLDEMRCSRYGCESSQCTFHNSDAEYDHESVSLDNQFINKNDDAMTIWDVRMPGFNLGKSLKENCSTFGFAEYNILVSLPNKIPGIKKQISPQRLDLKNYFSNRHGSLLFKVCQIGNLELVKYFIEKHQLNPHYVYPTNLNIMSFVRPVFCRSEKYDNDSPHVLKFLAGLGCDMGLTSVKGNTIASFVGDDDAAIPRYSNTKMLFSFGFNLDDIAQTFDYNNNKHSVTIGNRFSLGFSRRTDGQDIQSVFEQIELLKPQNIMNENVLGNVKGLVKIIITNMYGSNVIGVICKTIFVYLNVRDCCNVYQYTVKKNRLDKIMNSEFLK